LTDLRLEKNARAGSMTTIPVSRGDATEIYLNARCTAADFLQVELIDASTGHVVPGFSRDESARVTGDSARQRVEWKNAKLSALKARSFQVRVHFAGAAGSPRLYAIEFQ
jgi:hypothetical protein